MKKLIKHKGIWKLMEKNKLLLKLYYMIILSKAFIGEGLYAEKFKDFRKNGVRIHIHYTFNMFC